MRNDKKITNPAEESQKLTNQKNMPKGTYKREEQHQK